ncbi:hypothetical protein I4U23_031462 [Adineta vaga]|nr:hypothetical protein I4U23_031462 [Adineta vaga]
MSNLQVALNLSFWSPIILFSIGIPGALFNFLIFIGTKKCRHSPMVFYVVGQSISDIGILSIILLQSIPSLTMATSSISCKLMIFFSQLTGPCAMTFLCLSAFDRWACTSRSARIRQLSSIHIARYIFPFPFLLWTLINIPYLIFCDVFPLISSCIFTNELFARISIYFLAPIFSNILPLLILIIFSILTYQNIRVVTQIHVQQQPNRTRLSMWEQQMTRMMIIQTVLSILWTIPRCIFLIYSIATVDGRSMRNFDQIVMEFLIDQITLFLMSLNFASSFYIYFLSSSRLRTTIFQSIKRFLHLGNDQIIPIHLVPTAQPFTVTKHH